MDMNTDTFLNSLLNESMSERGNSLFVADESGSLVFFRKVSDTQYFQFAYTPGNYPAVESGIIDNSDAQLQQHITNNLIGWRALKCNVPGVFLDDDGCVDIPPTLVIRWGDNGIENDIPPTRHTFESTQAAEAFLNGATLAIDAFPDEPDVSDEDTPDYNMALHDAFIQGLAAAEGYADYTLVEGTSPELMTM